MLPTVCFCARNLHPSRGVSHTFSIPPSLIFAQWSFSFLVGQIGVWVNMGPSRFSHCSWCGCRASSNVIPQMELRVRQQWLDDARQCFEDDSSPPPSPALLCFPLTSRLHTASDTARPVTSFLPLHFTHFRPHTGSTRPVLSSSLYSLRGLAGDVRSSSWCS